MPAQDSSQSSACVCVLAVSPHDEDHWALKGIFAHSRWTLYAARSGSEAMDLLRSHPAPVIVCERNLPDGSWKDLFDQVTRMAHRPLLIVTSRTADDRLWAEVLNLGGFDVLAKPFSRSEVFHAISMAWRYWKEEGERLTAGRGLALAATG